MLFTPIVLFAAALLLSAVGTWLALRHAVARAMLDVPNHRSSHTRPTPRGGGIAIVGVVILGVVALRCRGIMDTRAAAVLSLGGAAVAAIGWLDDRRGLRPSARAAVQFFAAISVVAGLGGLGSVRAGTTVWTLGAFGSALAVLAIVWLTNLYNFLDGIDGLAAGNTAIVALFGALLLSLAAEGGLAAAALVIAGASAGFLCWNWPPARIFMGDVGSGFLGFTFGTVALVSERHGTTSALQWLLLLGVFVFDATITLVRRVMHGEVWHAAHRSHAYQRLVQAGWTHRSVTVAVLSLDALFGILALLVSSQRIPFWIAVASELAVLAILYMLVERLQPMYASARSPRPLQNAQR